MITVVFAPCSEGSVVASLETQFIKKATTGTEVVKRVRDVLTTVIKTGQLPAPPGETLLKTVVTALPQVAEIPDGAPSKCFAEASLGLCCYNEN